ncbi:MAG: DUF502 domain-containing protein [Bacteroidales bacterium]|nr:DUF502 domain-containing protein [Bacteroidales bacterium]
MKKENLSWGQNVQKKLYKRILDYFMQGLLFVAPIGITIYIIVVIFQFIDGMAQVYLDKILPFHIPGIGIIIMFLLITFFGFLGHRIITTPFKLVLEKSLNKAPLIQLVYTSIRDLISAFVGKEKKFTQPVLVRMDSTGEIERLGFLTASDLSRLDRKGKVAVYIPYSYAFMGELIIVPAEWVTPIEQHPSEVMKFIVSGGVAKLDDIKDAENKNS